MNEEFTDLQKLLQLKRHEKPGDHYFENFIDDFHSRQRSALLNQSARGLLLERIGTYLSGGTKPILASGVAFAAVAVGGISIFNSSAPPSAETLVSIDDAPEPISLWRESGVQLNNGPQLVPVEFSPDSLQFKRDRGVPRTRRLLLPEGEQQLLPSANEKTEF
ncbi:hypothetical protein OAF27_02590 [Verrucomicrobiales bacterium]|nr:hypothetical protein [Verrucomicrobiales bacterium]